jgi:hypothetical protein
VASGEATIQATSSTAAAEQRAGEDDDESGEHPRDAGAVDALGDRAGQLRAEHRPAEEARDGGGRHEQALAEPREREGQRQHDQHHVHQRHGQLPWLTVMVPT